MKQSLSIAIVVGLQLLATFAMQLLVVRLAGINASTDAYIAAQVVPSVLSAILMAALQSVWLPRLAVIVDDAEQWHKEQAKAQGQSFIMAVGVFSLLWATHIFWQPLFFPGFTAQQILDVGLFCGPLFLAAAFNTQSALLTVALRAKGRFVAAELIATSGSIFALISVYYTLPEWGLISVPWVMAVRAILVYAIQLWLANWPGISIKAGFQCKETWKLMRPLFFGASIYKTSPLIDRFWISQSPAGSMTAFSLAQTAVSALATILERSICTPAIPSLAKNVASKNYTELRRIYIKRSSILLIITIIFYSTFFFTSSELSLLVGETIQASRTTIEGIFTMVFYLSGFLYVSSAGNLLVSVFYSFHDTITPLKIGTLGFIVGLILKSIGFNYAGLNGLIAGGSIAYLVIYIYTLYLVEKKIAKARIS